MSVRPEIMSLLNSSGAGLVGGRLSTTGKDSKARLPEKLRKTLYKVNDKYASTVDRATKRYEEEGGIGSKLTEEQKKKRTEKAKATREKNTNAAIKLTKKYIKENPSLSPKDIKNYYAMIKKEVSTAHKKEKAAEKRKEKGSDEKYERKKKTSSKKKSKKPSDKKEAVDSYNKLKEYHDGYVDKYNAIPKKDLDKEPAIKLEGKIVKSATILNKLKQELTKSKGKGLESSDSSGSETEEGSGGYSTDE